MAPLVRVIKEVSPWLCEESTDNMLELSLALIFLHRAFGSLSEPMKSTINVNVLVCMIYLQN